jgi:hypothetical protein
MRLFQSIISLAGVGLCFAQQKPTINVEFEYQLEVQDSQIAGSTTDALGTIDGGILEALQNNFPEKNGSGFYLVKFNGIESEIFSACFTANDECSLVRSKIEVMYQAGKPEHAVEFVTLQQVQDYLASISMVNNNIIASYGYPSMVSSLAQLQMNTVQGRMNDTEIKVVEDTFTEVFGAIMFAMEGDTEIVEGRFLFQDLLGSSEQTLSTDLRISGYCRDCTMAQFEQTVEGVINGNIPAFQNRLMVNSNALGSTYFNGVSTIEFSVPELPEELPAIGDSSIFDETAPTVENKQPWFVWFGLTMGILVIFCGCYMIVKDNVEYEKEELSTSDESNMDGEFVSRDEEDGMYEEEGTEMEMGSDMVSEMDIQN